MDVKNRKLMMAGLVAAFVAQTCIVYGDDTALRANPLSPLAVRGRAIWLEHNCQSCHQLYGFGGFLGPDLTNAAPRLTRARLDAILTDGARQMPAFGLDPAAIDAVQAFLREIDRTGIGQARHAIPVDPARVAAAVIEQIGDLPLAPAAARGRATFEERCVSCHTLFRSTPLGPYLAADLSSVANRLSAAEIDATLIAGRPERGMPPTGLLAAQRAEVIAYLEWLAAHRDSLVQRLGPPADEQGLPWFEFR